MCELGFDDQRNLTCDFMYYSLSSRPDTITAFFDRDMHYKGHDIATSYVSLWFSRQFYCDHPLLLHDDPSCSISEYSLLDKISAVVKLLLRSIGDFSVLQFLKDHADEHYRILQYFRPQPH